MAAQFMATKRLFLRWLFSCRCRAINSLPVPEAPMIRMLASLLAT